MKVRSRLNVVRAIEDIAVAQSGYFTRAQAAESGVQDFQLQRAVAYQQIHRLGYGVYRVAGAGQDDHQDLRVMWLRLEPTSRPRARTKNPTLWVSHNSAATVLGLGVLTPSKHEFISTTRRQLRADKAKVRVRSAGLARSEWVVRDGFAVTSPLRTLADLDATGTDGGHLGTYLSDALHSGAIQRSDVDALNLSQSTDALLAMADKTGS
ncbi:MAG: type IV toxin-antitoxin system AbiEi family antitoxin domain-containing protein [Actinomycetota bacterium]|nr:type IV toxin-antitoxin system AbiEi family antitoxin domain-containing protein [Actinomycetota bacterium]